MEEERKEHEAKMKKMEQEMEQVFEMKVREKTQKLKDSEADVMLHSLFSYQFSFAYLILYESLYSSNADMNRRFAPWKPRNWRLKRSVRRLITRGPLGRTRPAYR